MAAMEIFWNRNYCDKFFNEMISYCGNSENTLARNLMILLSSIDIIDMSQLWSIMHISIDTPMRWLVACTHKMKEYVWVYISIGKVLDNLKYNLNMIVDQPELIHDKSFMMIMMDPWAAKLPPFQDYLGHKLNNRRLTI